MKIGIKYCGGCNSQFDRPKVLETIKKTFPEHEYHYANDSDAYDLVIMLQGCDRVCANRNYISRKELFDVQPSNLDSYLVELEKVLNENQE